MRFPAGAASAFLLSGCLYTTHHYNTGRLLEPGSTSVTLGYGRTQAPGYGCPHGTLYEDKDSLGVLQCTTGFGPYETDSAGRGSQKPLVEAGGPTSASVTQASLGYRLGVHGRFGPFTGAEIGLHLEAPTNPASAEFDLKLGLPMPGARPYHHSLSLGWGIGAWADNSWFAEYAASRSFGENDLFFNYRGTWLATQLSDLNGSESRHRFRVHRRFIHQGALGFLWTLPEIPVLPDFVAPEAVLTYPLAPMGEDAVPAFVLDDRAWDFNFGFGWHFR